MIRHTLLAVDNGLTRVDVLFDDNRLNILGYAIVNDRQKPMTVEIQLPGNPKITRTVNPQTTDADVILRDPIPAEYFISVIG